MKFKNRINEKALTKNLVLWAFKKISYNDLLEYIPWNDGMNEMEDWTSHRVSAFIRQELTKFLIDVHSNNMTANSPEAMKSANKCAHYIWTWYGRKCDEYNLRLDIDQKFPID